MADWDWGVTGQLARTRSSVGGRVHLLWLEYELWDIHHEVSAKYAHCH